MLRLTAIDDAFEPTRVRVPLRSREPIQNSPGPFWRPALRAAASIEPVFPTLGLLIGPAAWGTLLATQGPMVLAVTLFSPISSTSIITLVGLVLWLRAALRRHARRAIAAACARHECPACGQSLEGVPVNPQGLSRCPECAARWLLDERVPERVVIPNLGPIPTHQAARPDASATP